jgi:hypothetical protein
MFNIKINIFLSTLFNFYLLFVLDYSYIPLSGFLYASLKNGNTIKNRVYSISGTAFSRWADSDQISKFFVATWEHPLGTQGCGMRVNGVSWRVGKKVTKGHSGIMWKMEVERESFLFLGVFKNLC